MLIFFPKFSSPSKLIQVGWEKLKNIPGGNKIFSSLVSMYIPYTGTISPLVLRVDKGFSSVLLKDKKIVRNHLNSIHAIALANLGEFSTGLCLTAQLPNSARAILTKLEIEYLKKARGDLISEATYQLPKELSNDSDYKISAFITNSNKETVAKVHAIWHIRLH